MEEKRFKTFCVKLLLAIGFLIVGFTGAFAAGAGDVNCDGVINSSDLIALTEYVANGTAPAFPENADVNRDCCVTASDVAFLTDFLFAGGPRPESGCDDPLLMMPGDVNCDFVIDNSDAVTLTLILSGELTPCKPANADVNGDCCINADDRAALADFLFNGGPDPVDCTCHEPGVIVPGDVNCDGAINTADMTALVDMLVSGMPFGACPVEKADINGNGCVTQADLDALGDFLFLGGPIATCAPPRPQFPVNHKPGDANSDGALDIADEVFMRAYLGDAGPAPSPIANGDANGDCCVNLDDADYLENFLLFGGPPPPECTCDSQLTLCGDANGDGDFNIMDVTVMINRIFACATLSCMADATGDQEFNISDVTAAIKRIFSSGPPLKC